MAQRASNFATLHENRTSLYIGGRRWFAVLLTESKPTVTILCLLTVDDITCLVSSARRLPCRYLSARSLELCGTHHQSFKLPLRFCSSSNTAVPVALNLFQVEWCAVRALKTRSHRCYLPINLFTLPHHTSCPNPTWTILTMYRFATRDSSCRL